MTLAKFSNLILLLLAFLACKETSNHSDNVDQVDTIKNPKTPSINSTNQTDILVNENEIEEKIIDTIFKLPEVKKRAKYIDQQTKGKRNLKVWIEDTPDLTSQKYYWIKVGEDNGTILVTHFNFYVYPVSMRIMYYDINEDKEMTLDVWRLKLKGM